MRRRLFIWLLLILACFLGALYFWRSPQRSRETTAANPAPATSATPAAAQIAAQKPHPEPEKFEVVKSASTAPVMFDHPPVATNNPTTAARLKYRLSNTEKSLDELGRSDRGVLLENALIDSTRPVQFDIPDSLRSQGDPGSYIVQARGPIDDAFRARLTQSGAQIVSYIPNNAYLVRASAAVAQELAAQEGTPVLPYEPYYKLKQPLLKNVMENRPGGDLIVVVFPDARANTIEALQNLGATIAAESPSPFGPQLTVQNVTDAASVAVLPGVQLVQLASRRKIANDLSRATMGVSIDSTVTTNYLGLSGTNITVAVNDSGVDASLLDFSLNRVFGVSLTDNDGHGTHVAGIIAGNGSQSSTVGNNASGSPTPVGTNQFRGQAPSAKIFSMPINSSFSDFDLQQAAATNALISNNSWTYAEDTYDIAAASYDAATRDALPGILGSQGLLFVFAAGNGGNGADNGLSGSPGSLQTPATAKNVISVGALEQLRNITNDVSICETCGSDNCATNPFFAAGTDSADEVAKFSARGNVGIGIEGVAGRFKPDVVAPGVFVVSTRSSTWDINAYYNPTNFHFIIRQNLNVATNSINFDGLSVPCNIVELIIGAIALNPIVDLPIYVRQGDLPTTANFLGFNQVSLTSPALVPSATYFFGVGNPTNVPVIYDSFMETITTNDNGNSLIVLSNLNQSLGGSYRYESGTSMSAPAVSGMLALMEDFFTNKLNILPSPALLKAMLINGARSANAIYNFQVNNSINYEGWGLVNLSNSLPAQLINSSGNPGGAAPMLVLDQDPTNALATGQSKSFRINVSETAQADPLRITLVWTDPPGNPVAGVKLVNDLDLVVTNLDNNHVYFGNDIPAGANFTFPWDTNLAQNVDFVNNVENVFIDSPLATTNGYAITVIGHRVNVNAVTQHPNNVAQDYALVVSVGDVTITNALSIQVGAAVTATNAPNLTVVTNQFPTGQPAGEGVTGGILLGQHVGANTPLLGFSAIGLGTNTMWGTPGSNGLISLGMTNQWHFYVVTNTLNFTNAAFVTFLPPTLALPRMGVNVGDTNTDEATRPEADIDLFVTTNSLLLSLDPAVVGAATKSVGREGTEVVAFTNAAPQSVYYVGVHSEDQQAAEYAIFAGFSESPFDSSDDNGQTLRGFPVPMTIPDGSAPKPGVATVLAISTHQIGVRRVTVTNVITHENFGDLLGSLSHNKQFAVLNNHTFGNGAPSQTLIYEDNGEHDIQFSRHTDGPGDLTRFNGEEGIGAWLMAELDSAPSHTGRVERLFIHLDPQFNTNGGSILDVQPNSFAYNFIDVPPEATNLTINVLNITPVNPLPVILFVRRGDLPTQTVFDYTRIINPPGGTLTITKSDIPPLRAGRYHIGIFNPNAAVQRVLLTMTVGLDLNGVPTTNFTFVGPMPIPDDAVTTSSIIVTNTQKIIRAEVGVAINHPRISDLALTLISPAGKRILLMENRGHTTTAGAGTDLGGGQFDYLLFTENTNTAKLPIKFAVPPFGGTNTCPPPSAATGWTNWSVASGGNGHWYRAVATGGGLSWNQVSVLASNACGYLATITSQAENDFVFSLINSPPFFPSNGTGPALGGVQPPGSPEPAGGWTWVTGEPWLYTNWLPGSPDNGGGFFQEDRLHFFSGINGVPSAQWNDIGQNDANLGGYVIERDSVPSNNPTIYFPEESLDAVRGDHANGVWTLEVWDNRAGVFGQLSSWQLRFIFEEEFPAAVPLPPFTPVTNTVSCGTSLYTVDVPPWASFATNIIISTTDPLTVYFNQNQPPTGTNAGDFLLINNGTAGSSATLSTNGTPPLIPGQRYFLGIQNTNCATNVTYVIEVDYDITTLTNAIPYTNSMQAGPIPRYFLYDVSSNATAVSFQLLNMNGDLDLVARRGAPLPTLGSFDYESANPGTSDEDIIVFTNSTPVRLLAPGRWFLGVFNRGLTPVDYTILATEYYDPVPPIITLTNTIPYTNSNSGALNANADYYRFVVTNPAVRLQFEINNPSGDMVLVARKGLPLPTLTNFVYISDNPFTNDELIVVFTNSAPVPVSLGNWFLTAINISGGPVSYSIKASQFEFTGLPITITNTTTSSSNVCFTWTSIPGVHYVLEGRVTIFDQWVAVSPTITATGFSTTYCVPLPTPYHFFRVREGIAVNPFVPPPVLTVSQVAGGFLLHWFGPTTARYQVQWTPTILPPVWNSFTNTVTSTNGQFSFLDDGTQTGGLGAARAYRVQVLP